MIPVEFKQQNCIYGKNQPGYIPLPAHKDVDGIVTSYWKLSILERWTLLLTGRMYWQQHTFNDPLQPVKPSVSNPLL